MASNNEACRSKRPGKEQSFIVVCVSLCWLVLVGGIRTRSVMWQRDSKATHNLQRELRQLDRRIMLYRLSRVSRPRTNATMIAADEARGHLLAFGLLHTSVLRQLPSLERTTAAWRAYEGSCAAIVAAPSNPAVRYEARLDALFSAIEAESLASDRNLRGLSLASIGVSGLFVVTIIVLSWRSHQDKGKAAAAIETVNSILASMSVPAIMVCQKSQTVLCCNNAASHNLGYRYEELVGLALTRVMPVPPVLVASSDTRQVLGRDKAGRELRLVVSCARRAIDGHFVLVMQDVTKLMTATDELKIQKKVLSQFTHELRNKYTPSAATLEHILHAVHRPANELKAEILKIEDDVRLSLALLQEADQLIATRLELHKVYRGHYQSAPNVQTVELAPLLRQRVAAAAALANPAVDFTAAMPGSDHDPTVSVRLDLYMFQHLVSNLLSNARKHTTTGVVKLAFLEQRDGMLFFSVSDTGRGIPPAIVSRLFSEEVSSGDVRGVGLGLVSCRKFAEAVGGRVWLESTRVVTPDSPTGGGSEFRFLLPGRVLWSVDEKMPDKPGKCPHCAVDHITTAIPRNCSIYIVEDSSIIRRSIICKLTKVANALFGQSADWTFHEHETVESILPHIDDVAPNCNAIITVDQNLDSCGGQLRGTDLVTAVRRAGFRGVCVSASGDDDAGEEHMALGADVRFDKPFPRVEKISDLLALAFATKRRDASCAPSRINPTDDGAPSDDEADVSR